MTNKKLIGVAAALLLGSAVVFAPMAHADAALERAMDRAVDHYKRLKAGGANPGKGDMMKGGAQGDAMKSTGKGGAMKGGAQGDAMKTTGKGAMMRK